MPTLFKNTAENKPGIYRIVCLPTGQFYLGSAKSVRHRWHVHNHHLRNNTSPHWRLQQAWNRYGAEKFAFEVIAYTEEPVRVALEQQYLDETRCWDRQVGFNVNKVAGKTAGWKHDLSTIENLGSGWIVTYPDGKEEYVVNLMLFCERHGLDHGSMRSVAYNKGDQHRGGWKCRRADVSREQWQERQDARKAKVRERQPNFRCGWIVTDPQGKQYYVANLEIFCEEHGLHTNSMMLIAHVKRYHHKGWLCRRKNVTVEEWETKRQQRRLQTVENRSKPKRVGTYEVTSPDGVSQIIHNLAQFCRDHNLEKYFICGGTNGWTCRRIA